MSENRRYALSARPDDRQIDLDTPGEVQYWVKYLDTTRDELFAAVAAVGTLAANVANYLDAKKAGKPPPW